MIITYTHADGLYINMTNRCSNACDFCVRSHGDTIYGNLWLDREPTVEEIKESIFSHDLSTFSESRSFNLFGNSFLRIRRANGKAFRYA